ncbi:efflux transporter outer membrane subunit [Dysgonomonas sp. 216]|uniref:efflux transporter outer membrane subunit n=1 Tax=Dysgonomonas sp. 216 TaxID=2302934 RepID=UPI0013D799E9|nr:efflux transporter outer membrane subunit [Dysgonomonas sp. 216]NDW19343.1 efflux transporter outer membrane subunit [Dysgonomonas sp. 216]
MIKLKYILAVCLLCIMGVSSCKVGSKYHRPEVNMPHTFDELSADTASVADIGWSTLYGDTVLCSLIDKALEHNKDVLIATARIKEMIANKRITFAGMFPELGLDVLPYEREYTNYGGNSDSYTTEIHGKLSVGWELDIWGKLRWANDAGIAAYMQSVEARKALRLTIIAQVAQTYFELKALDQELEIVRQTLDSRKEEVHFAKIRYDGGMTSEIPYRQSLLELAKAETHVPELEQSIKLKENDLSVLLGEFPRYIRRGEVLSRQYIPEYLPVDLPSALLERRPDVRQAEQQLIQANANVGVAFTEMFPSIKLTGEYGVENSELTDLLKSPAWLVSGAVTGPIFNMGKNKAKHNAAKAAYEQEVYNYEKTILNVFGEVNGAIIAFRKAKEIHHSQEAVYRSAKSYQNLARIQYVNGFISYLDVLDAQRQLFDAQVSLNNAVLNELLSMVALYKALGGGLEK